MMTPDVFRIMIPVSRYGLGARVLHYAPDLGPNTINIC